MALHRSLPLLLVASALVLGGCIEQRRPRRDAAARKADATPAAAAAPAKADTPTEAAPAKAEPTPEAARPPAGDPNHKPGEASAIPNYAVPAGDGPSKGPEDALVTIVEFNAFDCPDCRKLPAILDRILEKHAKDARLVFRHAPAPGDESQALARAAVAAASVGKFWEVHDELMTRGNLGLKDIAKVVSDRGADAGKFYAALQDEASERQVKSDLAVLDKFRGEAQAPIVFVNGRYLQGAITFEQLDALVTEEKQKAEAFLKSTGVSRSAGLYEDMRKRGGPDGTSWRGYTQLEGMR